MTGSNKMLIISKDMESKGGVANYYRLFLRKFDHPDITLQHFAIGSRSGDYYRREKYRIAYIRRYLSDLIKFFKLLARDPEVRIILLNPSLIPIPLIRDGILMVIAKLMNRKVLLFVRGWDVSYADRLDRRRIMRAAMMFPIRRADQVLALADKFKQQLCGWGVSRQRIYVTRTMFDGELISRIQAENRSLPRFLFLSRISQSKGVHEIIQAAACLKGRGHTFHVDVVGFGRQIDTVARCRRLASEFEVSDRITFSGFVDGKAKYDTYAGADVFLLPSYSEGCPNSVLEAMASGLFVISTGVGALDEVVQDGVNGLVVKAGNWEDLVDKMEWSVLHIDKVRSVGRSNRDYAFRHFEARHIVDQIGSICKELLA
jgi:glycosyltransferase involved in cell wall biosynthesis